MNMKQKRNTATHGIDSDGELTEHWQSIYFKLIITEKSMENSIKMATSSVENIIFPMKHCDILRSISQLSFYLHIFVRLWGKQKKRTRFIHCDQWGFKHCENHDLRKTYGLAASSYPSQMVDTLTAHLSQQVLYTQSHNSKAIVRSTTIAQKNQLCQESKHDIWSYIYISYIYIYIIYIYIYLYIYMAQIVNFIPLFMLSILHLNKGLLAGPITWMAAWHVQNGRRMGVFVFEELKRCLVIWNLGNRNGLYDLPWFTCNFALEAVFSICEVTV